MSVMERRLQLLLDQERYAKVAEEARLSGRSVAAVIREAIDHRFAADGDAARRAAAARLLAMTENPGDDREPDWEETEAAMDEELESKFR